MFARQSSRLRAQPKAIGNSTYVLSSAEESDAPVAGSSSASTKAGSKRKRKSAKESTVKTESIATFETLLGQKDKDGSGRPTKKLRGKRGFLQQIAEMPLELLFEIFGQLDPMDVLNLARTTKSLRTILMQRSSVDIWEGSLGNVPGLPPTPDDLSEPHWVDLLFGKNCHVCGRTTSTTTQTYAWEARLRGCSKCVLGEFSVHRLPRYEYLPTFQLIGSSRRSERCVRYYTKISQQLEEAYKALPDGEARNKWISDRTAAKSALANVGLVGFHPFQQMALRPWAAVAGIFVDLMNGFKERLAKQQRDQGVKRTDVFLSAHQRYIDSRPQSEALLTAADLFQVPGVKEIVLTEPIDDEVKSGLVEKLVISKVPEYQEAWLKAVKAKMVEKMKRGALEISLNKDAVDESALHLALALFKCKHCHQGGIPLVSTPFRSCARSLETRSYLIPSSTDEDLKTFIVHTSQILWDFFNCFEFCERAARVAALIKTKLDLDPATTTAKALDELDPIFENVAGSVNGRPMYTWKGLVARPPTAGFGQPADFTTFVVLDEETSTTIREFLDEGLRKHRADSYSLSSYSSSYSSTNYLHCARCRQFNTRGATVLRAHIRDVHGVETITDDDVRIHPDDLGSGRHVFTYHKYPGGTLI